MKEDIIKLARLAGAHDNGWEVRFVEPKYLGRFAALVAAAEREACAQIAEEWLGPTKDRELHIAAAIRARGQT